MEERIMNLFSLIADQVQSKKELFDNEGKIVDALVNKGYHIHEADTALMIVQALVANQPESFFAADAEEPAPGIRAMNAEERARIAVEAFGFVSKLSRIGVINEDQRETILEKAMSFSKGKVGIDDMKKIAASVMFAGSQEHEDLYQSMLSRIRDTAWN